MPPLRLSFPGSGRLCCAVLCCARQLCPLKLRCSASSPPRQPYCVGSTRGSRQPSYLRLCHDNCAQHNDGSRGSVVARTADTSAAAGHVTQSPHSTPPLLALVRHLATTSTWPLNVFRLRAVIHEAEEVHSGVVRGTTESVESEQSACETRMVESLPTSQLESGHVPYYRPSSLFSGIDPKLVSVWDTIPKTPTLSS